MKCEATTAAGKPCRAQAKRGHRVCGNHSGRTGRPTNLTPTVIAEIDRLLRAGVPKNDAGVLAGASERSLYRWLETGEADDEHGRDTIHRQLWLAVKEAVSFWKADQLAVIRAAARGDQPGQWQAAAWLLERRYPQEFGRKTAVEVAGGDRPVQVERLPELDPGDKESRDLAHRLLDRASGRPAAHN